MSNYLGQSPEKGPAVGRQGGGLDQPTRDQGSRSVGLWGEGDMKLIEFPRELVFISPPLPENERVREVERERQSKS